MALTIFVCYIGTVSIVIADLDLGWKALTVPMLILICVDEFIGQWQAMRMVTKYRKLYYETIKEMENLDI
jgi:hypothetical protein